MTHVCWIGSRHPWNPDGRCFVCEAALAQAQLDLTLHATFDTRKVAALRDKLSGMKGPEQADPGQNVADPEEEVTE